MNIAFYHTGGILPFRGGISRATHSLANMFREEEHNVWFIGAVNKHKKETYDEKQVFLPYFDDLNSEDNRKFVQSFIETNCIEVVINQAGLSKSHTLFIAKCCRLSNIKIITCLHNSLLTPIKNYAFQKEWELKKRRLTGVHYILSRKFFTKISELWFIYSHRNYYRSIYDNSDVIITLCDGLKQELIKILGIKTSEKIEVIPNYVPNTKVTSLREKDNIILWIGTVNLSVKRIQDILIAWSLICDRFSNWSLKILGDGSGMSEAENIASKMNLSNVYFEGRVNPDEYYQAAKILCVTSSHESFSLVTVEGMQKGVVPIVYNSFPAAELLISNGVNGLLSNPFDVKGLADNISSLMDDNIRLTTMSINAKSSAEKFNKAEIYPLWYKILCD